MFKKFIENWPRLWRVLKTVSAIILLVVLAACVVYTPHRLWTDQKIRWGQQGATATIMTIMRQVEQTGRIVLNDGQKSVVLVKQAPAVVEEPAEPTE